MFIDLVQTLGLPVTLLVFVLWQGAKGRWVYGREHDELKADRNEWKDQALRLLTTAERATDVAEKVANGTTRRKR